ncbi:C40 family peptidase [bacterium]|nr:C40 family peptidase [bacterium]
MRIVPSDSDLKSWCKCAPTSGDLIFLKSSIASLSNAIEVPILPASEIKEQGLTGPWTLNNRSWYGYSLSQANLCTWRPSGKIEQLSPDLQSELRAVQTLIGVPVIIDQEWVTSHKWSTLSSSEKIKTLRKWIITNEVHFYEGYSFDDLPLQAQFELTKIGFEDQLNRFAPFSGPNCFATVASALNGNTDRETALKWMHWPELEQHLTKNLFERSDSNTPQSGDVLIFSKENNPVHAAIYLGENFYFEKPGQDFYEPYRVAKLSDWQDEWEDHSLCIWKKFDSAKCPVS